MATFTREKYLSQLPAELCMMVLQNYLERLPVELCMMVLQNLSQRDLCSVALVSKKLSTVALDPSLWPQLVINQQVQSKLKKEGVGSLLRECPRFNNVKSLKVKNNAPTPRLIPILTRRIPIVAILTEGLKSNSLNELDLHSNYLKDIPINLLTKAISKLKKVDLECTFLSIQQLTSILKETIRSDSLIDLNLGNNIFLKHVPTELLTKPVSKLKKLDLKGTFLWTHQLVAILEESIQSNSLVELNLRSNTLDDVPAELLAKAIGKFEKVNLECTSLRNQQLVAILEETGKSRSLTELNLGGNILMDVPIKLLSSPISKLRKYNLKCTFLSSQQIKAILEEILKSNTLIELNLSDNKFNEVPTELLTKAISKLKKCLHLS